MGKAIRAGTLLLKMDLRFIHQISIIVQLVLRALDRCLALQYSVNLDPIDKQWNEPMVSKILECRKGERNRKMEPDFHSTKIPTNWRQYIFSVKRVFALNFESTWKQNIEINQSNSGIMLRKIESTFNLIYIFIYEQFRKFFCLQHQQNKLRWTWMTFHFDIC